MTFWEALASFRLLTSLYGPLLTLQPFHRQKQKPDNSSSPCQRQGSENKKQDWTDFFFLFLNCCSEWIRMGKLKSCIYVVLPNLHWPKWALLQFSIASCFSLTLQLELAPWSSKAVITLPDQEIPLFQLDQLTKAAHNTLAQAAWPAQGENCVARSKKGGCDHSRVKTFTKAYIAEATNKIWSVTL